MGPVRTAAAHAAAPMLRSLRYVRDRYVMCLRPGHLQHEERLPMRHAPSGIDACLCALWRRRRAEVTDDDTRMHAINPSQCFLTACHYVYPRFLRQRIDMYVRLLREYAQSGSYWRRCCYVHACSGFLTVFSARFIQVPPRVSGVVSRLGWTETPLMQCSTDLVAAREHDPKCRRSGRQICSMSQSTKSDIATYTCAGICLRHRAAAGGGPNRGREAAAARAAAAPETDPEAPRPCREAGATAVARCRS